MRTLGNLSRRAIVAMIALTGLLATQAPATTPQPAGSRMILVDVTAEGDTGPIRNLKADDFVLEDRGKKVNLALFDVIDSEKLSSSVTLPEGVVNNRLNAKGQMVISPVVMLYDRINCNFFDQASVRPKILKVLSNLKDSDHIAFFSLGLNGLEVVTDFDQEDALLAKAAKALTASDAVPVSFNPQEKLMFARLQQALTSIPQLKNSNQERADKTYPAFEAIARHMGGVHGRKSLVWISSTVPLTWRNEPETQFGFNILSRYLTEQNVVIYPVDPSGAGNAFEQGTGRSLSGTQGMLTLAKNTGGKAYRNTNDISLSLEEVVRAATFTYTLGFVPDAKNLDGRQHAIKVHLTKTNEKAKLSYRMHYFAWSPDTPGAALATPGLDTVLNQQLGISSIGLTATTSPIVDRLGMSSVVINVTAGDLSFVPKGDKWEASIEVAVVLEGGGGISKHYAPSMPVAQLQQALVNGLSLNESIQTGPNGGVLHIAVIDKRSGLAGSLVLQHASAGGAAVAQPSKGQTGIKIQ